MSLRLRVALAAAVATVMTIVASSAAVYLQFVGADGRGVARPPSAVALPVTGLVRRWHEERARTRSST